MRTNEITRKHKGKKRATALALVAMLLIGVGATAAYFTDHHAVMNEFTVGQVKTELTESKWDTDESGKNAAQQLRPNMTIVKDPVIKNTGTSDSYNFIAFRIPYDKFAALGTFDSATGQCTDFNVNAEGNVDTGLKDLFTHSVNSSDWILVEDKTGAGYHEYVYAYATGADASTGKMTALAKGISTKPLFVNEKIRTINLVEDAWALKNGCVATENLKFNIPVRAYSIQTTDIITTDRPEDKGASDPATVWKVVKAQVNSKYTNMAEAKWGNVSGANNTNGDEANVHGTAGAKPSV